MPGRLFTFGRVGNVWLPDSSAPRRSWHGRLDQAEAQVVPSFNTLIVFNVAAATVHAVTPVSPYAPGKRWSVTGWWSHAGGPADPPEPAGFARWGVGAASYGAQPLALDEARGLLAL